MTLKTALFATILALSPALASAMCSGDRHSASSCAEGQVWDAATQACVAQPTT